MAIYFIGLGIGDEKDITLKGLDAVKKCDLIYLESYTSKLDCPADALEKLYGKKIIPADRDLVEKKDEIIRNAKDKDVAFLVVGDPFGATTHTDLLLRAGKAGIEVKIIHNASILNAVGELGLELYKYGRVTSIPFDNKDIKTPVEVFGNNHKNDLHTLFLLDLDPQNDKFMMLKQAIEYLLSNGVDENLKAVGCAALGSGKQEIKYSSLKALKDLEFRNYPQCLIIPAKMHFIEEEALGAFAV